MSIHLQNISFSYSEDPFLHNINLSISKDDQCIILAGKNGSGKSTLLNILCGFLPYEGKMEKTTTLGLLPFQDALFPTLSVKDNLSFFYRCFHHQNLNIYDPFLQDIFTALSIDYLDQKVNQCSSGERKKVALACTLLSKANVILLDEPFVAMDVYSVKQLLSLIEKWKTKTTFLITTHSYELADSLCDRLLVLEEGTIKIDTTNKEEIESYFNEDQ